MKVSRIVVPLIASMLFAQRVSALEVGTSAPDFSLPSSNGSNVSVQALRGQVVLVDIWASWCGTCKVTLPWLDELQTRYGKQGFRVVAVSVDEDRSQADKFVAGAGTKLAIGYDPSGSVPEAYGASAVPATYLIDKNGVVIAIHEGLNERDRRSIEKEIADHL